MAHRTFTDATAGTWQVWETRPGPRSRVAPQLKDGWLTFEGLGEPPAKRRLAPIPAGWALMSDSDLVALFFASEEVSQTRRTNAAALEESSAERARQAHGALPEQS